MQRDLYHHVQQWKVSSRRKPLLLRGARQTGKTWLLKEFGRNEYRQVIYCNFEEDPLLASLFERDLHPQRIIGELSLYKNVEIQADEDFIIFDEIQSSNKALNALKYFQEEVPEYHIAAAGSLLGVQLSQPGSFPVGKVNFLELHPLTFFEFLDATGNSHYRHYLEELVSPQPLSSAMHEELKSLLRTYYVVGGMPEVVRNYANNGNYREVRVIQKEIIDSFVLDFAKHAPPTDIPKLQLIWESIPSQLAKDNKKFIFSVLRTGARAREYENALIWLERAGLVHKAMAVTLAKHPLKGYRDRRHFKIYSLDIGLLSALASVPLSIISRGDALFNDYKGAFVENYVAQQLVSAWNIDLIYWRSSGGKAELDFLFELEGNIVPLEVKAGINPKSKSLRSYDDQFKPELLTRTTLLNFTLDGKIINIPLYALPVLKKLIKTSVSHT